MVRLVGFLIWLVACVGCNGSNGGVDDDGDASVIDDTDDSDVVEPYIAEVCPPEHLRCRGYCFSQAGQQQSGCAVLYVRDNALGEIDKAVIGELGAYVRTADGLGGTSPSELLWLDLSTEEVAIIPTEHRYLDDAVVYDGALYCVGSYDPWGDAGHSAIMKLTPDGTYVPATGMLRAHQFANWDILDGYIYMAPDVDGGSESIYRLPLGESTDTPFRPEEEPGAEVIAEGVAAASMATDGTYLYYKPDHASAGMGRVRIGAPETAEIINEEFSFNFVSDMGLPVADPDHIYFAGFDAYRVPRAGGPAEPVIEYLGLDIWAGDNGLIVLDDYDEDMILYWVDYLKPSVTVIDDDGEPPLSAAVTSTGYVVVSKRGVVRITF